jgi:hypothetical protein
VTTVAGSAIGVTYASANLDSLMLAGPMSVGELTVMSGTALPHPNLSIGDLILQNNGAVTLSAGISLNNVSVVNTDLVLNGHTLRVANLGISGPQGYLSMTNPADSLLATMASFNGGDSRGKLTAGVIVVHAILEQGSASSPYAFAASGSHRTVFNGGQSQFVTFQTPGTDASHFQDLEFAGAGTEVYLPNTVALGMLRVKVGSTPSTNGGTLQVGGLDVDGLILQNTQLTVTGGSLTRFDNVSFVLYDPTVTQLRLVHPGNPGALVMTGLNFAVTPTTGFYIDAVDSDGAGPPFTLTVQSNLAPAAGAAHTRTSTGPGPTQAQVTWQ